MPGPARDLVGYGPRPPDPRWPDGARLALNFVINYEEGSEPSIEDGDGLSEARLTETAQSPVPRGERDLAAESMFEYGSRVGFWRLKRLFDERELPFTLFACALALERNPAAAAVVREDGIDVCCHGWRWVEAFRLTEDEEREQIRRAVASLERTVGRRPEGWYCRYGPSINTRRLLVEEGGFLYDSDAYNDELPYWVEVSGPAASRRPVLACPQRRQVRSRRRDRRAVLRAPPRRGRLPARRRERDAADDVRRAAHAPRRPSGPRFRPRPAPRPRPHVRRRLGHHPRRDRPPLDPTPLPG